MLLLLFFKKETQLLIESSDINISNINRIDIVVGDDHGQGAFRFPIKILYIMNNGTRHESIQPVGYIFKDLGYSINSLNKSMSLTINSCLHQICICN